MNGDDAYLELLVCRYRFLCDMKIYYASRQAMWFAPIMCFAGNPKLNDDFNKWAEDNNIDLSKLRGASSEKTLSEWEIEAMAFTKFNSEY